MFDHIEAQFRVAARDAREEGERAGYGDDRLDGRDEPRERPSAAPLPDWFRARCEAAVAAQREQNERYRESKAAARAAGQGRA